MALLKKIIKRLKLEYLELMAKLFGKVVFKDKFGLEYYLWPDTRIAASWFSGYRTDDCGVIYQVQNILDVILEDKEEVNCVDVGTYIGVITTAMATHIRKKGKGKVFSFEPSKPTYERLLQNIELNRFQHVTALNKGVSDTIEEGVAFQLMEEAGGNYIIKDNVTMVDIDSGKQREDVIETETIGNLCKSNEIDCIDLIKIDAEGYDFRVINGAKELFKNGKVNFVICEYNQDTECSERCADMLRGYGYKIYYIVRNENLLSETLDEYPFEMHGRPLNLLAISPSVPSVITDKILSKTDANK